MRALGRGLPIEDIVRAYGMTMSESSRPKLPPDGLVHAAAHTPRRVAAQMVLRFNDGQLQILMAMARPIPRHLRSDWLISVAASLNNIPNFCDLDVWRTAFKFKHALFEKEQIS
jgi:hypothetical protein